MSHKIEGRSEKEREQQKIRTQRWRDRHPERSRESTRRWRDNNKEERFWHRLSTSYGISKERYQELFAEQNGVCAIPGCGGLSGRNGRTLDVDHDHVTGQIRGLLCVNCNIMLGHAKDRPDVLESAADWLRSKTYVSGYED